MSEHSGTAQQALQTLLAHLSKDGRQAMEIALGEALRIGHSRLSVEFLLMGLSKQDGYPLSDFLQEVGEAPRYFRRALRKMSGIIPKKNWRSVDAAELGAQNLHRLQPPDSETRSHRGRSRSPEVTPHTMAVLRDAVTLAGEEQVTPAHLLLAALEQFRCPAVDLLYVIAAEAGWDLEELPTWIACMSQGTYQSR